MSPKVVAPKVMICSEGKRLTQEAIRCAEELYSLLNMQLSCVLRRDPQEFIERRMQRSTRKLNLARAALRTHLESHGCGVDPTRGLCDYSLE